MSQNEKKPVKLGRPVGTVNVLTEEQTEKAIELARQGRTHAQIADEICVDLSWLLKHRSRDPNFNQRYTQARLDSSEVMEDEIKTAHDDYADPQRGRLKADNYKWVLSKRLPKVYGDRIDVNLTQQVDISGALEEAKMRTVIDVSNISDKKKIDSK